MFTEKMKNVLNEEFNESVSENGMTGYRTTGKELLDLNFSISSLRKASDKEIIEKFIKAFYENKELALKFLFFARDIRGGMGERRFFRVVLKELAHIEPEVTKYLIPLVAEYGRFDDLFVLINYKVKGLFVMDYLHNQIRTDYKNYKNNKPISLLAKWMPSINASSKKTKDLARFMIKYFNTTECKYRKTLSTLRKYLKVVEVKMCANKWEDINYSEVTSKANLIYNDAFLKHDEERRRDYLSKVEKGEVKINASTLFPHEIVNKYYGGMCYSIKKQFAKDSNLEALWKALPKREIQNTLVVADGSGSMCSTIGNTKVTALAVANALAIYFAENNTGEFKNKYITFSERPKFVDFKNCNSLADKARLALNYSEIANTNIEAVFDLILTTAKKFNVAQEDMPKNILIISDMEFDGCAHFNSGYDYANQYKTKFFKIVEQRYKEAGYLLPKLAFWNVNSRTGTIPIKENELGVALVSGFSTAIADMIMSNKTDPYQILVDKLMTERYAPISYTEFTKEIS